jgi:hypothetical protein
MPKNKSTRSRSTRGRGRDRRLSIRSELRAEPDLHKIARAVVTLAMAQAEKEAQAAKEAATNSDAVDQPQAEGRDQGATS